MSFEAHRINSNFENLGKKASLWLQYYTIHHAIHTIPVRCEQDELPFAAVTANIQHSLFHSCIGEKLLIVIAETAAVLVMGVLSQGQRRRRQEMVWRAGVVGLF